jgi:hypothetical protein
VKGAGSKEATVSKRVLGRLCFNRAKRKVVVLEASLFIHGWDPYDVTGAGTC